MTRKEYRKRKVANDFFRQSKKIKKPVSLSSAFKIMEALEKIASAIGHLSPIKRKRVLKAVAALHGLDFP